MRKSCWLAIVPLAFMLCSCGDLLYNAKTGNIERIQNGLDSGAWIEKRDHLGNTPLMIAAFNKQYEALEYLYKRGANVNAQNRNGATALILAAYYNHLDTAKILLKYNPDKTIKDNYGNTALDYAEQNRNTSVISFLQNSEATPSNQTILKQNYVVINYVVPKDYSNDTCRKWKCTDPKYKVAFRVYPDWSETNNVIKGPCKLRENEYPFICLDESLQKNGQDRERSFKHCECIQ